MVNRSQDINGVFYIVQPVPELAPGRIKLGWTEKKAESRLEYFRTLCPNARLVDTWPCRKAWERAAIDFIGRGGGDTHHGPGAYVRESWNIKRVGGEVFECWTDRDGYYAEGTRQLNAASDKDDDEFERLFDTLPTWSEKCNCLTDPKRWQPPRYARGYSCHCMHEVVSRAEVFFRTMMSK